ncbi:pleiotropic drug resistance protein 1 [Quercus suber]|uniref:Pleiotropic drug resistance protein 1 n=1 Tax=Quercus suber TaxID=58331 RepID=A0AAW0JAI3_QUESU
MEAGDLYNAGNSFRRNSSSIWRSGGVEAYSKSSGDEDDEEALKWAALEKLPTFNRLKKGLLTSPEGETSEIDIHNLGLHERKILIDRLLKIPEEDNEKFLLQLRNRIDRVGIDVPTIEVRFEHLSVEAETHVGSRALPTLFSFIFNILEDVLSYVHFLPSKKKRLSILQDVSGIIKPGRMALLLGPPSSGKTTLLLALAGKLDPTLKFSGGVTYNGHDLCEFIPQRTAAYISQHDLHIAEMTVRETLAFSARCQGVGWRQVATEGQETSIMTDYVLKVLGLEVCADTIVGDQMVRGISGGQKKRVTTGKLNWKHKFTKNFCYLQINYLSPNYKKGHYASSHIITYQQE